LREPKRQQWSEKTGLSGSIRVRPDGKNWLVRINPCQAKLQKVAGPNETLSDYFVKVRL